MALQQTFDFIEVKENSNLTIQQVSEQLNVSIATIRNWIKTGYLAINMGKIDQQSFEIFKNNSLGKEKLTKRANKQYKDSHEHIELEIDVIEKIKNNIDANELHIWYEQQLSNSYKNKEGIYYTPQYIIDEMFEQLPKIDYGQKIFCDPCCGTGNFLIKAMQLGFKPENVYGFDTDSTALKIAQYRLQQYQNGHLIQLQHADFLQDTLINSKNRVFDVIFTNPPWGKKLDKKQQFNFMKSFGLIESKDTTALFFKAALDRLSERGYLGFLVQEAFFNIGHFEEIRQIALSKQCVAFIDFEKAFQGLITKAQAILLKKEQPIVESKIIHQNNHFLIHQSYFKKNPKSIINFNTLPEEIEIIKYLFSLPHITLKDNAKWGLGIVTGNNGKFLFNEYQKDTLPIYTGKDLDKNRINIAKNYFYPEMQKYQQTAPIELYLSPKKMIYRFISSELFFAYDDQKRFILNSVNFFILDDHFELNYQQLSFLLNTNLMSWLFKKIFYTHKVLRMDLECLPIFNRYFQTHSEFDEFQLLNFLNLEECDGTYRIKTAYL